MKDLTGLKFNSTTVLEFHHSEWVQEIKELRKKNYWLCKCDCGEVFVRLSGLIKTSYGCKKCSINNRRKPKTSWNKGLKTADKKVNRLKNIWYRMKDRCYNRKHSSYLYYGAKGIIVCQEWKDSFINFLEWSKANGYENPLTLDRKDGTKGYSPENCRWVTKKQQSNNRKDNIKILYNGLERTISEISELTGTKHTTIYNRYRKQIEI